MIKRPISPDGTLLHNKFKFFSWEDEGKINFTFDLGHGVKPELPLSPFEARVISYLLTQGADMAEGKVHKVVESGYWLKDDPDNGEQSDPTVGVAGEN